MDARKSETNADNEIVLARVFDASREHVWKAWTEPQRVAKWWGPRGFSTQVEVMDVREGGDWILTMIGPDGARYPNHSRFTEVVALERIAFELSGKKEGGASSNFRAVWTFTDLGQDRTELKLRLIFASAAERDANIREFGSLEGARQTLARLSDFLQVTYGGKKLAVVLSSPDEILLTRTFQAPAADVFRALTDAASVARWWAPRKHEIAVESYDARPGGRWRVLHKGADGRTHAFRGEFREVTPCTKIVRTFEFEPMAGHACLETILLEDTAEGTRVSVRVRFQDQADRDQMLQSGMEWGANQSFDRLEETLASGDADFVIERSFDAPRRLVFEAWTNPGHLAQWMGPKGSRTQYLRADVREGGMSFYRMSFNGVVMWGKTFYRQITPPSRLVYVQHFADEQGAIAPHPLVPGWPREMLTQVAFEEQGSGRTKVTLRWSPLTRSATERAEFEKGRAGMTVGWGGSFEVLAEFLAGVQ